MSMLSADATAKLGQLLEVLQSSDNNLRKQAEEHLHNEWISQQPGVLLIGLAEQMSAANSSDVGFPYAMPRTATRPPTSTDLSVNF
jgi:importin-5